MKEEVTSDKASRFKRLAVRRVTESIKKMQLIGNLANRNNYSYNEEQVKQILEALDSELRHLKSRFRQETSTRSQGFYFKK